jgi:hypothetical protein
MFLFKLCTVSNFAFFFMLGAVACGPSDVQATRVKWTTHVERVNRRRIDTMMSLQRPSLDWYSGALLGVGADVLLDRKAMRAHITLKGPVFPGAITGVAQFADSNALNASRGEVVIDEPLKSVLKRRFVSIQQARYDQERDEVVVCVKLPVALGNCWLKLKRVR